jgi:sugar/nucleoside kinase (ribokinase family)
VVVKDGARPTTVLLADGGTLQVPVPAVEGVRDSTGAGDAFAAGWLSATMEGRDGTACVQRAHELARAVLTTPGASPDRPGGRT